MKQYTYFPGCSATGSAKALGQSVEAVAGPLGLELKELEDWTCCGSTPYGSLDEDESVVVAARNLALADKTGLDTVTPCSSCFTTLNKAYIHLKEHEAFMSKVNQALAVAGLEFKGNSKVRLLAEVIYHDVTPEELAKKVKKNLNGLKVASFYGCQMVRPYGFENPESPVSLDKIVESMGGTAVDFPMKNRCCGGSLIITEEALALGMMRKIFANAMENGAECIITPCPLCQTNLDAYQASVNGKFGTNFNLPVLFVTQLIGLALGIDTLSLGLNTNIVSTVKVIEKINTPVETTDAKQNPS